jgi:L-ascorbate metabolism protein UlaG (beta-lactamase superfamily)
MNIIWLGHGSFRFEIGDQVLLLDPWLNGNPMLEGHDKAAATEGATQILVTHGHFDHTGGLVELSRDTGLPVSGMVELVGALAAQGAQKGTDFNIGGTVQFGDVAVSMVPAAHSSSMQIGETLRYMGHPTGFVLHGEGKSVYVSGDTGLMADMAWIGDYHKPEVGILSAGGHYTMDMKMAAYAARAYFDFKTVIPCHYKTFPLLEQSAEALIAGLPGVTVIEPEVMVPITL